MINRTIFHPIGYALAIHTSKTGDVTGWSILGTGGEVWDFTDEDDDDGFYRFRETMRRLQLDNGSTYS